MCHLAIIEKLWFLFLGKREKNSDNVIQNIGQTHLILQCIIFSQHPILKKICPINIYGLLKVDFQMPSS